MSACANASPQIVDEHEWRTAHQALRILHPAGRSRRRISGGSATMNTKHPTSERHDKRPWSNT
jgi:hypothetical protein